MGRLSEQEQYERDQEVAEVHGAAEDGDCARVAARSEDDEGARP